MTRRLIAAAVLSLAATVSAGADSPPATRPATQSATRSAAVPATLPSWCLGPFARPDAAGPVIRPDPAAVFDCPMRGKPIHWEALHTFNPAAVVMGGKVCVLYRAEDDTGAKAIGNHTSRLGLATSDDGLHFTAGPTPVFYPAADGQKANEWDGGCEDPRAIATDDGRFVMTYTQWNHNKARLAVATTADLVHWEKHGPIFADPKYKDLDYKSGAIVGRVNDAGTLVAAKINGTYWMYWGEGSVRLAHSPDLIHWDPVLDDHGKPRPMLPRRAGHFDSDLVEGGPPAVLTPAGIVVVYNGKNAGGKKGDESLGGGAYAGGQALFDAADPTRLIDRTDSPFFKPEQPWERTGQYAAGTTFVEGLVPFKGRWFLYYGCADSFVGVASAPER